MLGGGTDEKVGGPPKKFRPKRGVVKKKKDFEGGYLKIKR